MDFLAVLLCAIWMFIVNNATGFPHDLKHKEIQIGNLYTASELFDEIQEVIGDTETWTEEMVDLFMSQKLGTQKRLKIAVFSYHNGLPVDMLVKYLYSTGALSRKGETDLRVLYSKCESREGKSKARSDIVAETWFTWYA